MPPVHLHLFELLLQSFLAKENEAPVGSKDASLTPSAPMSRPDASRDNDNELLAKLDPEVSPCASFNAV